MESGPAWTGTSKALTGRLQDTLGLVWKSGKTERGCEVVCTFSLPVLQCKSETVPCLEGSPPTPTPYYKAAQLALTVNL